MPGWVGAADAFYTTTVELPAPPAVVWDWLNSPAKMKLWGADEMVSLARGQRRGVGTTNHCVHGNQKVTKKVLDWKPPFACLKPMIASAISGRPRSRCARRWRTRALIFPR